MAATVGHCTSDLSLFAVYATWYVMPNHCCPGPGLQLRLRCTVSIIRIILTAYIAGQFVNRHHRQHRQTFTIGKQSAEVRAATNRRASYLLCERARADKCRLQPYIHPGIVGHSGTLFQYAFHVGHNK